MIGLKNILISKHIVSKSGNTHQENFLVSTDSRTFDKGQMFVALVGDNFDGVDYIDNVMAKGCPVVVYTDNARNREKIGQLKTTDNTLFLAVDDTLLFLQDISERHLLEWKNNNQKRKVIGITGSNGKTTNKEMLFNYLNHIIPGKVACTKGNLNNHIGVPLTLLQINESHDLAIVEMGTNHPGEIRALCKLAHPDAGLITNIGSSHLEFFHSEENVFVEKRHLFDALPKDGIFVQNLEDKFLAQLPKGLRMKSFGKVHGDYIIKVDDVSAVINESWKIENQQINGEHNYINFAATFILALQLFPNSAEDLLAAAKNFRPAKNRSAWIEAGKNHIFMDAYNANPSSMKVAVKSFADYCDRNKIAKDSCFMVLGDMNELGENAPEMHRSVGAYLLEIGLSNVAFIGRYSQFYVEGHQNRGTAFGSKEDFHQLWREIRKNHIHLFLKASRSLQLESLLDIN